MTLAERILSEVADAPDATELCDRLAERLHHYDCNRVAQSDHLEEYHLPDGSSVIAPRDIRAGDQRITLRARKPAN